MKKAKLYIAIIVGLAFLANSCIDEISLDIDNDTRFIIVDGLVTDVAGLYSVRVNNSPQIGVGNDNILDPIEGCQVNLLDDMGRAINFIESTEERGTYERNLVGLDVDRIYHIEVVLPDGDVIVSEPQPLPSAFIPIESIEWDVIDVEFINESGNVATRPFVEIYANSPPIETDGFVRWRVTGEYDIVERAFGLLNPRHCYVKQSIDLNDIVVANTSEFDRGGIAREPVINLPMDSRFNIQYLFNVSQFSLNEAEYNYWSRIEELVNVDGTLFDPPPGVLKGNLINTTDPTQQVQGYFSVARLSFVRRFVNIFDRGFFVDTDCESRPNANNPAKCVDCTTLPNSSLEVPPYWIF